MPPIVADIVLVHDRVTRLREHAAERDVQLINRG
jgi:hypothetical protein